MVVFVLSQASYCMKYKVIESFCVSLLRKTPRCEKSRLFTCTGKLTGSDLLSGGTAPQKPNRKLSAPAIFI